MLLYIENLILNIGEQVYDNSVLLSERINAILCSFYIIFLFLGRQNDKIIRDINGTLTYCFSYA